MSLDSNEEELSGLDWEAEKAYIVATSPRSNAPTASQESDEFSWDMDSVPISEKPDSNNYCANSIDQTLQQSNMHPESPGSNKEVTISITPAVTRVHSLGEIAEKEISSQHCSDVQEEVIHFTSSPPSPMAPPPSNGLQMNRSAESHVQPQQAKKFVHNTNAHTLIICGPPGLGRGTLVQKLVYRSPQRFCLAVSHTTRSPRLHETYARDFYFVSRSEMSRSISRGKFIEYVQVDNDRVHPNKSYSPAVARSRSTSPSSPSPSTASSSNTGDLFGTTWDAFYEAQYSGKPCIVLNVTGKGAEQLKDAGIQGHYVCLQHSSDELKYSFTPDNVIHIDSSEECFHDLEKYALSLLSSSVESAANADGAEEQLQWERVPTIQLQASTNKQSPALKTRKKQLSQSLISYTELLTHFQNADLSTQLASIRPENRLSGLDRLLPPPRVSKKLHRERDMVFAIALCHFSDNNSIHTRTLHTVYCKLTGETTCQRFGPHWEDIGFQGSDPVDDLRGVGMLGLVQLVWLLENPNTLLVAQEVFRCVRNNVPFCVLSLNITSLALATLREGGLSRECNRREQVFAVLNDFYAAVLLSFSHSWRHKKRGFMESGLVLQEVGTFARKHARYLIRELEQNLKERQQRHSLSNTGHGVLAIQPAVRFTPLDELTSS